MNIKLNLLHEGKNRNYKNLKSEYWVKNVDERKMNSESSLSHYTTRNIVTWYRPSVVV